MINSIFKDLLNVIFPTDFKCVCCGEEINNKHFLICNKCFKKLKLLGEKRCEICDEPIFDDGTVCVHCKHKRPVFNKAISKLDYDGLICKLVKDFKYRNATYLAETLGSFLIQTYLENGCNADVVVPVPLHYLRYKDRGYNQSELLAKELCEKLGLEISVNNLVRVFNTKTQTDLTRAERQENLHNAFVVKNKKQFKNKTVLLVDDVYTTGSTLNECATALRSAGCKDVFCITLCHNSIQTRINKLK